MFLPFVTTRSLKCNDRLINGLFKISRFSCTWENNYFETSIIWIRRLQRQDKLLFKLNYAVDKDQTTKIYYVMVKTFLIQLLILQEYIWFAWYFHAHLSQHLQANCNRVQNKVLLNIFLKTKKVEKVITTLKGRIGHPLKRHLSEFEFRHESRTLRYKKNHRVSQNKGIDKSFNCDLLITLIHNF